MSSLSASPADAFDPSVVPTALRGRDQWVCWKIVTRGGRPSKVPINAATGDPADATDPATWTSFEEAVSAWRSSGRYAGVGFVFSGSDPFTGVDLDGCVGDDGGLVASAREIVSSLDSYTEISPSGRGVKVFLEGAKPGTQCRSGAIPGFKGTEVYSRDRFFTVTGRHVPGTPRSVQPRQAELRALCRRLWAARATPTRRPVAVAGGAGAGLDDDALISKARAARNGAAFSRLWDGDTSGHGDDRSGADFALCGHLAFWTGCDAAQMDRLFRRSGLMRGKWDQRRRDTTYGAMTIAKAIEGCADTYTPRVSPSAAPAHRPATVTGAAGLNDDGGPVPLGATDPATGRLVLSPRRTLPTAEAYVREFHDHPDGRTLHAHAGVLMGWEHNRYRPIDDGAVRHTLQPWLHAAGRYVLDKRSGAYELAPFESNPTTVNAALESVRDLAHLPSDTASPCWLGESVADRPPASEILCCRSMNLHIPTGLVIPATPALFTTSALGFDFDPDPEPPEAWTGFLEQLFGEDLESVECLQEFFGYCLVPDTSQQKMLLLVGPRRSGKGTVGRVLRELVGPANCAGPTTAGLAGHFGLQPLLGKSLAVVSDARFRGEGLATVVERLLCISGEDAVTVDRKHLAAVTLKLPTRFLFLSNELPRLADASSALPGRFLVLRLTESFYDREDTGLTERLLEELPGILLWAVEGWKRLHARGRFVQPASGREAVLEMEDLASPVGAFVRERCVVAPGRRARPNELYLAWCRWCQEHGRDAPGTNQSFGRDLAAAAPGVRRRRGTDQVPFYEGIDLREGVL